MIAKERHEAKGKSIKQHVVVVVESVMEKRRPLEAEGTARREVARKNSQLERVSKYRQGSGGVTRLRGPEPSERIFSRR